MKLRNVTSLVVLLLAASAVRVGAWEVCVDVVCGKTKAPLEGVTVVVTSTDCKDERSGTTDDKGHVCISLLDQPCCYAATIPGFTISGVATFCLTVTTTSVNLPLETTECVPQPGECPECVDEKLGLGVASGCTVLELSTAKVSITGPAGGILGDICIAPGGSLAMSGDEFVTGTINLGAGAKFSNSSHGTVNVAQGVDLSAEISAAYAAAANAAGLGCTKSFTKLDGSAVKIITGVSGLNVICVQDIVLSGKQILLTGPADALFVFNVTGKFVLTGGGAGPQIRVDTSTDLLPKNVLYNIIGTGPDVAFSGGGGGENCCAAIVDGTLLAPDRKINLSPGLVNGEVISAQNINIVSGSSVRCPPCK